MNFCEWLFIANSLKPQGLAYYARRQSERHIGAKSFIKPLKILYIYAFLNGPNGVLKPTY